MAIRLYANIPGYPGYLATDDGEIISECRRVPFGNHWRHVPRKTLRFGSSFGGYRSVALCCEKQVTVNVHKLVMLAFRGPANGLHINHKNGNKLDNRLSNLEYVTQAENNKHAIYTLKTRGNLVEPTTELLLKAQRMHNLGIARRIIEKELKLSQRSVRYLA